jgi:hypothetical protein
MIYMKKIFVLIFGLVLVLMLTSLAFAQQNKLAFFKLDVDLATAGYQGGSAVDGIGSGQRVGFAVYVKNVDQLRGFKVDFTWDGAKAAYNTSSGTMIELDEVNVNNETATLTEDNALGSVTGVGEVKEAGHYAQDFAKLGGDPLASEEFGLIYLLVLKTETTFSVEDSFTITAKITIANDGGVEKFLGERIFYVNGAVDVKTSTWGEIKNQFKD